jgi:histone acetyltransferase (RNA polymerase elongator complex component)
MTAAGRPLEVAFFGGSFSALPDTIQTALLEPLQPLLKNGELAAIRISTRPDYIDHRRVEWLAAHGVRIIELGVQSLDDGVLTAAGRGHTAADSVAAIGCIKAHGLQAGAQLMPGLPGDTPSAALNSLHRAIAAGADFIRLYPTIVLRGTELARRYAVGDFVPLELTRGIDLCKILLQQAMRARVPVIRIGLQADEGLTSDTVLAGCWHPALGHLVRSQLYADLISYCVPDGECASVTCHPARLSDVVGLKRTTLLTQLRRGVQLQVETDAALAKEELWIQTEYSSSTHSIISDLHYSIHEV